MRFPYRERARRTCCALAEVEPGSRGSTSQLTLGRSPTRGGAAASWDKFENLSGPRWVDGIRRDRNALLEIDATMGHGHFALTPTLSHSHAGFAHRSSFCGRGSQHAAEPRASHRSDSPTPARRVGSGGSRTWSTALPPFSHAVGGDGGWCGPGSRTARRSRRVAHRTPSSAPEGTPTGFRWLEGCPLTQGSCCAATLGYIKVSLQGTCAADVVRGREVEPGLGGSTSQLTLGRSPTRGPDKLINLSHEAAARRSSICPTGLPEWRGWEMQPAPVRSECTGAGGRGMKRGRETTPH